MGFVGGLHGGPNTHTNSGTYQKKAGADGEDACEQGGLYFRVSAIPVAYGDRDVTAAARRGTRRSLVCVISCVVIAKSRGPGHHSPLQHTRAFFFVRIWKKRETFGMPHSSTYRRHIDDLSNRLIRPVFIPSVDVVYRGCGTSECTLRRTGASLSSSDERVLRRAQKIMERLHEDSGAIKGAILKHGV